MAQSVQVIVRVRPHSSESCVSVVDDQTVAILDVDSGTERAYTFDRCFSANGLFFLTTRCLTFWLIPLARFCICATVDSSEKLYADVIQCLVPSALQGYNMCILAYGMHALKEALCLTLRCRSNVQWKDLHHDGH